MVVTLFYHLCSTYQRLALAWLTWPTVCQSNEGHYSFCMQHPFSPDNELAKLDQMVDVLQGVPVDCLVEVVEVEQAEEVVQLAELVVAWGMEQGCEELDGCDIDVEQLLEAMQLDDDCVVEALEVQLAEKVVEVEEEVVQLAELVVVVVA